MKLRNKIITEILACLSFFTIGVYAAPAFSQEALISTSQTATVHRRQLIPEYATQTTGSPPSSAPGLEPYNSQIIPTPVNVNQPLVTTQSPPNPMTDSASSGTLAPQPLESESSSQGSFTKPCETSSGLGIAPQPLEIEPTPRGEFMRPFTQLPKTSYSDELPIFIVEG